MSDVFWQYLLGGCVTIVIAWMQSRTRRSIDAGNRDAQDRDVQSNLRLDKIEQTGEATHMLCNSAMLAQKRLTAKIAREKANITHSGIDVTAANAAEEDLLEHERKQANLDKQEGG
jgi:hypothetical protein